jgi:hypothetical protein
MISMPFVLYTVWASGLAVLCGQQVCGDEADDAGREKCEKASSGVYVK